MDGAHVRSRHHAALHATVQPEGLGDPRVGDGLELDRRAGQRPRLPTRAPQRRPRRRRRRLGAEQHVQVPSLRRNGGDLQPRRRASRRATAIPLRTRRHRRDAPHASLRRRDDRRLRHPRVDDADRPARRRDRRLPHRRARGGGVPGAQRRPRRRRRRRARPRRRPILAVLRGRGRPVLPRHELREVLGCKRSVVRHRALLVVPDRDRLFAPSARRPDPARAGRGRWPRLSRAPRPCGANRVGAHHRRRLRIPDPDAGRATRHSR